MRGDLRPLRTAAYVEAASLLVLLVNLATVHWDAVSSATGPVHGCAYLITIAATFAAAAPARAKLAAFLPAIGGLLALRMQATSGTSG
ncbi:DUF3817 domain-containing protein [Saccharopolyspora gloriosae]|uniref:DUF3817 domain-containing protein n=1 Tax=Saccharopolyspora gloriosae TaxID=455344 RepID=UPI001FB76D6B|nr:DUF3817 domain-containing protein [Saccharopolyspora gloriosae]